MKAEVIRRKGKKGRKKMSLGAQVEVDQTTLRTERREIDVNKEDEKRKGIETVNGIEIEIATGDQEAHQEEESQLTYVAALRPVIDLHQEETTTETHVGKF